MSSNSIINLIYRNNIINTNSNLLEVDDSNLLNKKDILKTYTRKNALYVILNI